MSTQVLTILIVGASFALYIAIALWARAGSTQEFYNAGGDVHPIVNGMAPEGIGTLGMLLNFLVALVESRFTTDAPEEVQAIVESIRFPKGSGEAQAH